MGGWKCVRHAFEFSVFIEKEKERDEGRLFERPGAVYYTEWIELRTSGLAASVLFFCGDSRADRRGFGSAGVVIAEAGKDYLSCLDERGRQALESNWLKD